MTPNDNGEWDGILLVQCVGEYQVPRSGKVPRFLGSTQPDQSGQWFEDEFPPGALLMLFQIVGHEHLGVIPGTILKERYGANGLMDVTGHVRFGTLPKVLPQQRRRSRQGTMLSFWRSHLREQIIKNPPARL